MQSGSHTQKLTVATGSHTCGGKWGKGPSACAAPAWKCWVCTVSSFCSCVLAGLLSCHLVTGWMLKRGVWVISWFTCLVREKCSPQCVHLGTGMQGCPARRLTEYERPVRKKCKAEHPGACSALEGTPGLQESPTVWLLWPSQSPCSPPPACLGPEPHRGRGGSCGPRSAPGIAQPPMGQPEVRSVEKGRSCLAVVTHTFPPSSPIHTRVSVLRPWAGPAQAGHGHSSWCRTDSK